MTGEGRFSLDMVKVFLYFLLNKTVITEMTEGIVGTLFIIVYMLLLRPNLMRLPTMWYVRPAKPQISLRIRAVYSEPFASRLNII